jgi:hypothetical protein
MPATVNHGMIRTLITFKNNEVIRFVVGRTQTPWTNEQSPPAEVVTTTMVDEIAGFKKADTVSLCYPDPAGSIEFRGQRFTLISDDLAFTQDSRFLYCSGLLKFDLFPVVTFRQHGIVVGVIPTPGNETKDVLLPTEVSFVGRLVAYVNHPPVIRTAGSKNLLEMVVELIPKVTV